MIDTQALGQPMVVACYLITGKENALLDMGYRSSAESVIRDLESLGVAGDDDLGYLLPTHVHLDHSGSCGTLARRFPTARVLAHEVGVPHLSDPTRLVRGAWDLFGEALMRNYGLPDPVENKRLRGVADEETISLGGGVTLRALWTPGHASHHLSYVMEGTGMVFTGDAVSVNYPDFQVLVPTTPPPSFDLDQTLASIERIRSFSPSKLLTPHFGEISDPEKTFGDNVRILQHWQAILQRLSMEHHSVDDMAEALIRDVCERAGRPASELPEHLRISIKVDVLGFIRYLGAK